MYVTIKCTKDKRYYIIETKLKSTLKLYGLSHGLVYLSPRLILIFFHLKTSWRGNKGAGSCIKY